MRSKKITAAVLGIVLTLGLVVSGCGNSGTSSDGSAKAETKKDGYQVVNIGFPSAGYQWAEGALAVAEEKGYLDDRVLVIYLPDCHESIAGIVAGRIRERYYRPVYVLTDSEDGVKGSGRSIEAYHMFEELIKCSDLLTKFGGHRQAAGLSMEPGKAHRKRSAGEGFNRYGTSIFQHYRTVYRRAGTVRTIWKRQCQAGICGAECRTLICQNNRQRA